MNLHGIPNYLPSDVTGTVNQIVVTDDGDSTITLSLHDDTYIVDTLRVGTNSTGLLGSYTIAILGPDSSNADYPSFNFYTDADVYPILAYLPYAHNNFQIDFNNYWNGSAHVVCHPGGIYRIVSYEDRAGLNFDYFSIEWYDGSGDAQGDTFAEASFNEAFTIDVFNSQIVLNLAGVDMDTRIAGDNDANLFYVDAGNDRIGIREAEPETLTEWTHTEPYLTIHNSTHEDTDGGRESRIIFKGEQSGGEETAGFQFEASHDGTGDDQNFKGVWSANAGAGLAERFRLDSKGTKVVGLHIQITTQTDTDYTALSTDDVILVSTGATTRTITLAAAATLTGKKYYIKKIDAGAGLVTVDADGSETIDGDLTPDITAQYESWTLVSDGSNWHVL